MIDDLLMLLAMLGASRREKAVLLSHLKSMPQVEDAKVDADVVELQRLGYIVLEDDRVFLTQRGLLRTFSRFS